jgi:hypothetical protein
LPRCAADDPAKGQKTLRGKGGILRRASLRGQTPFDDSVATLIARGRKLIRAALDLDVGGLRECFY